jgi:uncharacterized protein (TIGR03435 family)
MKTKSLLILLSILLSVAYAQDKSVPMKVGAAAPPLHLDVLLQAPRAKPVTWDALKGNVVVIEFWATWCGPCRTALPHLNELAAKYQNKPVRFISITDEEEWKVKAFLSVNPTTGWVGIDREGSLYKAFGFKTIPQTILVDQKGRVAAFMQPSELTTAVLDSLLAGQLVSTPISETTTPMQAPVVAAPLKAPQTIQDKLESPLVELMLRPAKPSISMSRNRGMFKAKGMTLQGLVAIAYSASPSRVLAVGPVPSEAYEVLVRVPNVRSDLLLPMLQQAMTAALGLRTWKEEREVEVLILRLPAGQKVLLRPSEKTNSNWMTDDGSISGSAMTIENFRMSLEDGLHTVVLDETGLKGTYDIAFYWNFKEEASVFQEIKKQLGLELIKERRTIEMLYYEIGKALFD